MAKSAAMWGFIIYLIFGLYFINISFSWISMPGFLTVIEKWLGLIAGLLLIVGGINFFKANKF